MRSMHHLIRTYQHRQGYNEIIGEDDNVGIVPYTTALLDNEHSSYIPRRDVSPNDASS